MTARHIEYLPLDAIQPAARNPRRHAIPGIRASIARFGFATPALRDERTGRLVAGHGRTLALQAMKADGEDAPAGVKVDAGEWLVPVICGWESRSDTEADAYLVADNRHTELAGWDDAGLHELLASIGEVDPELVAIAGYTDDDLTALLDGGKATELPPALTDPDDVPGTPAIPYSTLGDLWRLGDHRLLCADSLNPQNVDVVLADLGEPGIVYTDPPYGISVVNEDTGKVGHPVGTARGARSPGADRGSVISTTRYLPVAGDASPQIAADAFRLAFASFPSALHIWWGGNHYAGSAALPDGPCWLVWDKETNGHFADAELAWTNHDGAVRLLRHMWNGMLRASERGAGQRVHPTQKPVALAEWAFGQVDPRTERRVVLDLFGGSGSTLIAAHRTGRRCAMIELEPHYVDTIARRWQEHVGQMPVHAVTGKPHDFTSAD